jgi:Peptidase family M1 domain
MKFIRGLIFLTGLFIPNPSPAQQNPPYWQQEIQYNINVTLLPDSRSLKGDITIKYTSHAPESLDFIWFHLWPNGYKDQQTALFQQLSKDPERRKKLKDLKEYGFIDGLNWNINGTPAKTEAHPQYGEVVKLLLAKPLTTGESITITTPFQVKIPGYFSRLGFEKEEFMITQWYPKPAVFDRKGWHPIPYLDQGEFYSEFGSFDVSITLPSNYVVAASGTLQNAEELAAYKKAGQQNTLAVRSKVKNMPKGAELKEKPQVVKYQPANNNPTKTLRYTLQDVHDFAWFADPDFMINYDTLQLPSGKIIDAFSFYHPESMPLWFNSLAYVEDAVRTYSSWIGEYPYTVVNAVEGPRNGSSGGMEYPTVTLITSPDATQPSLDAVITHEVGHNWFYGILGSNERNHAWMDEGMNSFYQFRYEASKYRANSIFGDALPAEVKELSAEEFEKVIYMAFEEIPMNQPIDKEASLYKSSEDYGISVYLKAARWMRLLEENIGRETLNQVMHEYFSVWKFKHPYPEDFQAIAEKVSGKDLKKVFALLKARELK